MDKLMQKIRGDVFLKALLLMAILGVAGMVFFIQKVDAPVKLCRKSKTEDLEAKNKFILKKGEPIDIEKLKASNWFSKIMEGIEADQKRGSFAK